MSGTAPRLTRTANARANTVSGDGRTAGGWDGSPRAAAVWWPDGTETLIIPPTPQNPSGAGEVQGMNSDGTVIVGGESSGQAFRWTPTGGYELLGSFPGASVGDGEAHATSEDGSTIVGAHGAVVPGVGPVFSAFVWTEEDGMLPMPTFLQNQGIEWTPGPDFTFAFDITPDGTAIVGRRGDAASPPLFDEGYLVHLPPGIRYGLDASATNSLDLVGTGSSSIGNTLTVTTAGAAGAQTFTLVGVGSDSVPALGGVVLVDLALPVLVATSPTVGGVSSFDIPLANDPTLVGAKVFMQSITSDASKPRGFALSNGIKVVIKA